VSRRSVVATLGVAILLLGLAAPASGAPLPPRDLKVAGGEETWHPSRSFALSWTNPPTDGGPPLAAVNYRLRDPNLSPLSLQRIDWPATWIEQLSVPAQPGAYRVEIWLEDAGGESGAPAEAQLRFDDARPGSIAPPAAPSWIGRTGFPLSIRLGHPSGPAPVSGIRGYAVSVGPPPGRPPCASSERCTEAETDLRGGAADDPYVIADLPEGTSYLSAVAVSGSGMSSATAATAVLHVDQTAPATTLGGAIDGWANGPVRLIAHATDADSGMSPRDGATTPFTAIAVDGGAPATAAGASVTTTVIGEGTHRVAYYARDLAGNVDDGAIQNGIENAEPRTALVRIDRGAPQVAFFKARDPRDPELLRARVRDGLSGPVPGRGWIGVRRAGSGDRFERLTAQAAATGELRARWDSETYPTGDYEFRAVGYDAAGNATASNRSADGAVMVLPNPIKGAVRLRAGFGHSRLTERSVAYGSSVPFGGRMTAGASIPPSGTPLRIVERFDPGPGPELRVTTTTTDAQGGFAIRLGPGPSRVVTAAFDGTPTLSRAVTPPRRLGVRGDVRLTVSSRSARVGGRPLTFDGLVAAPAGAIPAEGKTVQLQFRLPGMPWSEFRTIQTDLRGRFRYRYRFSDDDSRGVRFRFRAYAPAQDDWPYEPAGSRPVVVRGR